MTLGSPDVCMLVGCGFVLFQSHVASLSKFFPGRRAWVLDLLRGHAETDAVLWHFCWIVPAVCPDRSPPPQPPSVTVGKRTAAAFESIPPFTQAVLSMEDVSGLPNLLKASPVASAAASPLKAK